MSKFEATLSDRSDCHITLTHDPEDPSTWIIRRWKRGILGNRMILSRWFLTQEQAEAYARKLIKESDGAGRISA
jgi:hypothetical protein